MSGRLRLLHAIHDFLPRHQAGSEIYAFDLCRELAQRHDVTVVCAEFDLLRQHADVDWRVHEGLAVVEITNNQVVPHFRDTYRSGLITQRLEAVLHAIQPDVLHVHSLMNLSFDLPALAQARGIPVVATLHDYSLVCPAGGQRVHRDEQHRCEVIDVARCARCYPQSASAAMVNAGVISARAPGAAKRLVGAARQLMPSVTTRIAKVVARTVNTSAVTEGEISDRLEAARRVLQEIDLIAAPSPSIALEFTRLGADPAKVRVCDYGTAAFEPHRRRRRSVGNGLLRIGFVGTLVWHKGAHVLIDALKLLPSGSFECFVYGDPAVFPEYSADLRARSDGLPVRFMGKFERSRRADVYASFDVLVVPSLWMENSPLVIHEAFIAGVPVVGSRIGGIADLVQHGTHGLLVEPGSPDALAGALVQLIVQPSLLRELSSAVPAVKSMAEDAAQWDAWYAEVIAERRMVHAS